jgi:hypothetical protein
LLVQHLLVREKDARLLVDLEKSIVAAGVVIPSHDLNVTLSFTFIH